MTTSSTNERDGRALIDAVRQFAVEDRRRSWFHVISTIAVWMVFAAGALAIGPWPIRLLASVLLGLTTVRVFILYHDHFHGALLADSRLARIIMWFHSIHVAIAPSAWVRSHSYHHAHNAKIVGSHIGSYPIVTTGMWAEMSNRERLRYRQSRHPLAIIGGYLSMFVVGLCINPFRTDPRRHVDAAFVLVGHVAAGVLLWLVAGWDALLFAWFIPLLVACSLGAYLFYVQHNFADVEVRDRRGWTFTGAALHSSSFMRTGKVMGWFTGNIGYHHVHHLSAVIPFYRLPEAMAATAELRDPHTVYLNPRSVIASFRANVWDPEAGRMVSYREATARS